MLDMTTQNWLDFIVQDIINTLMGVIGVTGTLLTFKDGYGMIRPFPPDDRDNSRPPPLARLHILPPKEPGTLITVGATT